MDDGSGVEYPPDIRTIASDDKTAYRAAAQQIEQSGAEAIWLQHEFGIFGGVGRIGHSRTNRRDGPAVDLDLARCWKIHGEQEAVLKRLIDRAERTSSWPQRRRTYWGGAMGSRQSD